VEEDRHSEAREAELVTDPEECARLEARNALRQFDLVIERIEYWTAPSAPSPFRLRLSTVLDLHRAALEGLSGFAGNFRPAGVGIKGSKHEPPGAFQVAGLIEELCDYVNDNFGRSAVHLAAYALWRLNWIHPFTDGNGRTARALSYLVLCIRLGYRLPGTRTIPEFISDDKTPYYKALETADAGDLKDLEEFVHSLLARQLLGIAEAASDASQES
jgi:Fic family protein